VSRPTNLSKYEETEAWMTETFGARMKDYLQSRQTNPISVAVVDVDRVFKLSGARQLLLQWRTEDAKSTAGRPAIHSADAALALILLQISLNRPTLIKQLGRTFLELSPRQRAVIGLGHHDRLDERVYDRLWAAIQRLISLVDEFPGPKHKVLTEAEYVEVLERRSPEKCRENRERMFILGNALVEGSRKLLPRELRERSEGNFAIDATFVALGGKAGNPSSKNLEGARWSINSDGGFYRRDGDHGAVTYADAKVLNKTNSGDKILGTKRAKSIWGVEIEIARMTKNHLDETARFPLLTTALSYHVPGEIIGEGLRMVASLHERGHKINLIIVDRAYSNGKYAEYAVPVRLLGGKNVFDYKIDQLGKQGYDPRGFILVSGSWFLDTLPQVLIDADRVFVTAKNNWKAIKTRTTADDLVFEYATNTYRQQLARRAKSRLLAKGRMEQDWTRRYLIPIDSPDYAKWAAKPLSHQGSTVTMKRPIKKDADKPNAGGLKHEQYFHYGTEEWRTAYAMRNVVESANRNLKRTQFENIADPDIRAVHGNTFTYIVVALAAVVENMRQILTFYKSELAIFTMTAKNNDTARTYWQSDGPATNNDETTQPPG
jgi:hypothetical protein